MHGNWYITSLDQATFEENASQHWWWLSLVSLEEESIDHFVNNMVLLILCGWKLRWTIQILTNQTCLLVIGLNIFGNINHGIISFPQSTTSTIAWAIWNHCNNVIFRNFTCNPVSLIENVIYMYHNIELYNRKTKMLFQENNNVGTSQLTRNTRLGKNQWLPPPIKFAKMHQELT